jgi:hypothetical protein
MPAHYGFIDGVPSEEGAYEELDCFFGDDLDSTSVYIIEQKNLSTDGFDEHKVMLAFDSEEKARKTYVAAFSDGMGEQRLQRILPMTLAGFKEWVRSTNQLTSFGAFDRRRAKDVSAQIVVPEKIEAQRVVLANMLQEYKRANVLRQKELDPHLKKQEKLIQRMELEAIAKRLPIDAKPNGAAQ